MNDIFISYAREDVKSAERLAKAFEREGWVVWWDRSLLAGDSFESVIREKLDDSRCVIVLWSANSIGSDWVRGEARLGNSRGVLVPVLIDDKVQDIDIPIEFQGFHTERLLKWRGDPKDATYRRLAEAVKRTGARPTRDQAKLSWAAKTWFSFRRIAVGVVVLGVAVGALWWTGTLSAIMTRISDGINMSAPEELTWNLRVPETTAVGDVTTIDVTFFSGDDTKIAIDDEVSLRVTGANPATLPVVHVDGEEYRATYEPTNAGSDTISVVYDGALMASNRAVTMVVEEDGGSPNHQTGPNPIGVASFIVNVRRPATLSIDGRELRQIQGQDTVAVEAGKDVQVRLEWKIDNDGDGQWDCVPWDSTLNLAREQIFVRRAFLQCSE